MSLHDTFDSEPQHQNFKHQLTKLIENHDGMQIILSQYNLSSEATSEVMMRGLMKELNYINKVGGRKFPNV